VRILLLQEADWFNKGPHHQHVLLEKMSQRGHQVKVIDYLYPVERKKPIIHGKKEFKGRFRFYEGAKVDVTRPAFINLPLLNYFSYAITSMFEISRTIKNFKPEVIIGYCSVLNNFLGMKFAKKYDIPYIYFWVDIIHELIPQKYMRGLGKRLESKILQESSGVFVINKMLAKYIQREFGFKKKIDEIPGGVQVSEYQKTFQDKEVKELSEKYGIKESDIVLFFMGWIYEFSGLKETAEQLLKYKDEKPNFKLLIVGKGDYYPQLKEFVKENDLEDRVILTGFQPHEKIPSFLALADICILPAYCNDIMRDIVPIKMYEYMASGCPVITTKLPGLMEEFKGDNGVLYVDKPKDAFVKAIELFEKNKISEEGKKALKRAKENDWETITDKFEQYLERLTK
jgi:glycosyltransferase involved in cell wall biosynthesis